MVVRNKNVLQASLDRDQLALLKPAGTEYIALNGTGPRIWELIEQERSLGDLCDTLLAEFAVTPDECWRATEKFMRELIDEDVVRIVRH